MTEMTESVALEIWSTPSCPFTIEYSRRMLDDIRLAVVDAFFSLPRGGAEIGGVLLGKVANGRVTILEYAPLECEHIFGPSFTLSPADHGRLAEILSGASHQFSELQPVGWYHSHTRSDIFLSDGDLDLHNRYFPEPWQVALVLRPSTFQPVQGGFFFREPDGSIHTRASYQEFSLDPMPVGQMPRGMPSPAPQPIHRQAEPEGPVITLMAAPVPMPVEPPPAFVEPAPTPQATPVPQAAPAPMPVEPPPIFVEPAPAPQAAPVAEAVVVPADEPAPPARAPLLPPALPPIPRLELVPEPSEAPRVPPNVPPNVPVTEVPGKGLFIPYAGPGTYEPAPPQHQPAASPHTEAAEAVTHTPWPLEVGSIQNVEAPAAPMEPEAPMAEPPIAMTRFAAPEAPAEPQPQIEPAPVAGSKPVPQTERSSEQAAEQAADAAPSFLSMEPVRSRRKLWVVGAAAVIVVLSAGGYQQRASWLPQVREMLPQAASAPAAQPAPVPAPVPLTLPLTASDQDGQLQIRWDGTAKAATQARDGILQINDDGAATDLPLDAAHLQGGVFTYARHGEHVDARLTVQELDGTQVRTVTSFYGALPEPAKAAGADPALRKQNSDLSKKNGDLASKNAELAGKNADLTKINAELLQRLEELGKQSAKLKADMAAARTATAKENTELAQQNAQLHQQRDDLAKQNTKLKADLAARAAAPKQNTIPSPAAQSQKDVQLTQERDDLLIQIAKLKSDMTAQAAANKQGFSSQQNAEFSKQRYQLVNRVSQLESDLAVETARADKLARQLEDSRKQQTQRRLQNQSGDPTQ
jgi:proteasome lid subunit RPN8/RPN11